MNFLSIIFRNIDNTRRFISEAEDLASFSPQFCKLNFIKNLIYWEKIDNKEYIISLLPKGTAFLVVSVKSVDLHVVSYYVQTTSITELADNVAEKKKNNILLVQKLMAEM